MPSGSQTEGLAPDVASVGTGPRSSTKRVCVAKDVDEEKSLRSSQTRPSQIEWQEEADIYIDDDLPFPG